ncbi:hypothetical protein Salat_2370500 [Sesamum alatum]|uniref:Uncharacterized protein n=1 Tax=Sesamum alatum TaxID=300844 RepID=A0AAE1XWY5_9LAMI|nr:hypothetical protein Salat_2370500 [Sesamum alatum]
MATSALPLLLLLSLFAAAAVVVSARPCKTLFYFSATTTTTTTYYPFNSLPRNPNSNSILRNQNPRYLTLIFTSTTTNRFPDRRPSINFESSPDFDDVSKSSDFPLRFYSSVSSSIRDRTKDIMSVVGALLFGVGCGALTAATMYFVWSLFSPGRFDVDDVSSSSSDDDDDDDVTAAKKKLGYVSIPTKPKVVDDYDLKKPAPPAKEVV